MMFVLVLVNIKDLYMKNAFVFVLFILFFSCKTNDFTPKNETSQSEGDAEGVFFSSQLKDSSRHVKSN